MIEAVQVLYIMVSYFNFRMALILHRDIQNHNPQVIIVDEIGTVHEAESARTIAQRGKMLSTPFDYGLI